MEWSVRISMDTKNQMTNEQTFFIDGYWHDTLPENIDIDGFDKFDFKDCTQPEELWLDPAAQKDLNCIHKWLADEYISKMFDDFEMKQCAMWSGVDEGSRNWHNDYEDGDSFNSNILIYLDDNTKANGNNIQVRTGDYHFTLYPKRRDFVWLNQKKCFQHRAQHLSGTRRVLSFEYLIPALF